MRYLSVCSGIEAATVAWHPMGWSPVGFSEIEKFPSQVLAHHYPDVPNLGDMNRYEDWPIEPGTVELLVGGTPCQSFSVAGLRKGISDPRGNLALVYLGLLDRLRPRWCVWENVPGVLTSSGGRDFGAFLGGLSELGYGFAYRVLDAQWFGVAQRRRRVFVVGYLGDWRRAAAVLFERESFGRHPAPSRESRKEAAHSPASGARASRVCIGFNCKDSGLDAVSELSPTMRALNNVNSAPNGGGSLAVVQRESGLVGAPSEVEAFIHPSSRVCIGFDLLQVTAPENRSRIEPGRPMSTLSTNSQPFVITSTTPVAIRESGQGWWIETDVAGTIDANMGCSGSGAHRAGVIGFQSNLGTHGNPPAVAMHVDRRMTPLESQCFALAVRGHEGARVLEFRDDGTANCLCVPNGGRDGLGPGAVAFKPSHFTRGKNGAPSDISPPLSADADKGDQDTLIYQESEFGVRGYESAGTLRAGRIPEHQMVVQPGQAMREPVPLESRMQVRRLTPVECERLQGFPDGYSAIPVPGRKQKDGAVVTRLAVDGARYKALGNSMAVPVMRWIGERIQMVEEKFEKGSQDRGCSAK
jgi:DNA (cytosine-5)-methyltransferase 1